MSKRVYQSPTAFRVLPDVLCEISFPLDGSGAEIANSKEYNPDLFDEEEYEMEEDIVWPHDVNLWE